MLRERLLTPTAYFPPATWLTAAAAAGGWDWQAQENYQKGGWRNRARIVGPNGEQLLSVPLVKGKHQKLPVREVRISYRTDWDRRHAQAIRTAYGRAPYFEYFAPELLDVLLGRPTYLHELNDALLQTIVRQLRWPVRPEALSHFVTPGAAGYRRPEDLPASLPPYPQVFTDRHGFVGGLSVLDALFCLGPQLAAR